MPDKALQSKLLRPPGIVLSFALVSYLGYYNAHRIGAGWLHQSTAALAGAVYFASIFFGPFYVYIRTYLSGVSLPGRILATALVPFIWMTKDVLGLLDSHPPLECIYWYLNPLNIWMACLLMVAVGGGTLVARLLLKRHGHTIKVFTPTPVFIALIGITLFAGLYAWGQGENLFSLYLHGYRFLFGGGI